MRAKVIAGWLMLPIYIALIVFYEWRNARLRARDYRRMGRAAAADMARLRDGEPW